MNHYRFLNVDFEPRHFAEFVYYKAIRLSLEFSVYERTSKPFWKMNLRDDLILVPKFWNSCKWRVLKSSWHIYIYYEKETAWISTFFCTKTNLPFNSIFCGNFEVLEKTMSSAETIQPLPFQFEYPSFFLLPNSPVRYSNTAINEHGFFQFSEKNFSAFPCSYDFSHGLIQWFYLKF